MLLRRLSVGFFSSDVFFSRIMASDKILTNSTGGKKFGELSTQAKFTRFPSSKCSSRAWKLTSFHQLNGGQWWGFLVRRLNFRCQKMFDSIGFCKTAKNWAQKSLKSSIKKTIRLKSGLPPQNCTVQIWGSECKKKKSSEAMAQRSATLSGMYCAFFRLSDSEKRARKGSIPQPSKAHNIAFPQGTLQ